MIQFFLYTFLCLSNFRVRTKQSTVVKNPPVSAGDAGGLDSVPGSESSPGEGNGNPLQCSCLETSMDRGAWWATVHGVTNSQT